MKGELPSKEERRLGVLFKCRLLDAEPEESFDQLTKLAAQYFRVPIAVLSLVDDRRQWCKSSLGLSVRETERDRAFCAHAIQSDRVLVVEDASQDPRFRENPLVTSDPFVRFYAGAPLIEEGVRLGSFAVMARQSRTFSGQDCEALQSFSRLAVNFIHQRLKLKEAEDARKREEPSYDNLLVDDGPGGLYRSSINGEILVASKAILDMLGYDSLEDLRQRDNDHGCKAEGRSRLNLAIEEGGQVRF